MEIFVRNVKNSFEVIIAKVTELFVNTILDIDITQQVHALIS